MDYPRWTKILVLGCPITNSPRSFRARTHRPQADAPDRCPAEAAARTAASPSRPLVWVQLDRIDLLLDKLKGREENRVDEARPHHRDAEACAERDARMSARLGSARVRAGGRARSGGGCVVLCCIWRGGVPLEKRGEERAGQGRGRTSVHAPVEELDLDRLGRTAAGREHVALVDRLGRIDRVDLLSRVNEVKRFRKCPAWTQGDVGMQGPVGQRGQGLTQAQLTSPHSPPAVTTATGDVGSFPRALAMSCLADSYVMK